MALWEYKVITSGPHGFASPALLETHLNTLGKDEWEIIHFQTLPNNPLAFHGLARRSTMRDWTPPEVAVVAPQSRPSIYEPAKSATTPPADEKPELPAAVAAEVEPAKNVPGTSLRTFRDTERDQDPQAEDEEEDWDNWEDKQDELPTFFEAIKPLLRRNQKGPGQSVPLDQLARRWEQRESDIVGALKECGLSIPESDDADPEYFEFEGDLFWVNRNGRGQLFINSRDKPRPAFRIAKATKLPDDDPAAAELVAERVAEKAEIEKQKAERLARQAAAEAANAAREAARAAARQQREAEQAARAAAKAAAGETQPAEGEGEPAAAGPLPAGAEILERIRPQMRRNRRGPGYSGSIGFLARALSMSEADLIAAFAELGLHIPENANDKPVDVEIDGAVYWINKDGRGGVWINGREKRPQAPVRQGAPVAATDGEGAPVEDTSASVPPREASPGPAESGPLAPEPSAEEKAASKQPEPASDGAATEPAEKVEAAEAAAPAAEAGATPKEPKVDTKKEASRAESKAGDKPATAKAAKSTTKKSGTATTSRPRAPRKPKSAEKPE